MNPASQSSSPVKIFNIGFHKTGTTSLTRFMSDHDVRTLHNTAYSMERLGLGSQLETIDDTGIPADIPALIDRARMDQVVSEYDFFSDNPWPLLYRQLDVAYPDSRFILTRRSVDSWISSLLKYSGTQNTRMRGLVYGYGNPHDHIKDYRRIYLRHNRDVLAYFGDREDFLVFDIEDDNRRIADTLKAFAGLAGSTVEFPNANRMHQAP